MSASDHQTQWVGPLLVRLHSLQGQIMLFLTSVLFITLLIIGISVYALVRNAERELWLGRQAEAGRNAATQAGNYINLARVGLQFVAQLDDPDHVEGMFHAALDNNPGYLEFVTVSEQGNVLGVVAKTESVLANLFTIPASNWFRSAQGMAADYVFLGEVQVSPEGIPYIIISSPARSGGVVALRLSLDVFSQIVAEMRVGSTGTTYVVQSAGIIAAHPDPEVMSGLVSLAGRQEFEAALGNPNTNWTGSYINFQGKSVIGTSASIPGTNLVVITEIMQAEATAQSRNALLILLGITTVFWVGVIIINFIFVRRRVFVPLAYLQQGANEVEAGNLQYQVQTVRQDEIGALTESFNAMTRRLSARAAEREQLIRDLQAAKRLAEENSRIKSEFLSTMSHELRTPMNAIEGFTSIMLSGMGGAEFNDKTERYLTRVNVNSKRLLQLINDFLDLSRVESGRLELACQPFSPAELARRWQAEIGVLAEKKNIHFELDLDPHLPEVVYGDEEAISKVALNLLSNAIKFTEQGKVLLALANGGSTWRIVVADTGIGIPPHAREYIFEEFRQVDQTSKRKYGGTGLGLAIAQKYTRTMGGAVSLQSKVGEGSTFTVTLPLRAQLETMEYEA